MSHTLDRPLDLSNLYSTVVFDLGTWKFYLSPAIHPSRTTTGLRSKHRRKHAENAALEPFRSLKIVWLPCFPLADLNTLLGTLDILSSSRVIHSFQKQSYH